MDAYDWLIVTLYLAITAALGVGYGWLLDGSLVAYAIAMPFMFTALLFILLALAIVLESKILKNQLFYTATLWFYAPLVMTGAGKALRALGFLEVGNWLYDNRLWGLPIGLHILGLGVAVFVINEYRARRAMEST